MLKIKWLARVIPRTAAIILLLVVLGSQIIPVASVLASGNSNIVIQNPYIGGAAYKGQLHCHTTNSDGVLTPTQLMTAYKNAGYNFVAITDHNVMTTDPGVLSILFIAGEEHTLTDTHEILLNITSTISGSLSAQDAIDTSISQGGVADLAHPNYSTDWSNTEINSTYGFSFVEVYNAVVDALGQGSPYAEDKWDYAISHPAFRKVWGVAVDDYHKDDWATIDKGWVVVYSSNLSTTNIISSLAKGNFYSSNGPDLGVTVIGNTITAATSSSANITWIGTGGATLQTDVGVGVASYTVTGSEGYVRVVVTRDSDGKKAWSQPLFITNWLSSDWEQRVKVTANHTGLTADLVNFPALLYLSADSGLNSDNLTAIFTELGANSKKIAVTTCDGETECYVEIERWDNANNQSWLWVNTPLIRSTIDTDFYLYFDNDQVDNDTYVGITGSVPGQNVWDTNFALVLHMPDNPDTSHIKDSTSNANNGTKKAANEPFETIGVIDNCQSFNGTTYINNANGASLQITSNITVEAWVNSPNFTDTRHWTVSKDDGTNRDYTLCTGPISGYVTPQFFVWIANVVYGVIGTTALQVNTLYYQVGTYNGSYFNIYLNAQSDATPVSQNGSIDNDAANLVLGYRGDGAGGGAKDRYFTGLMDEVRVSNIARSPSWVKGTYLTGTDTLLSYSFSAPTVTTHTAIGVTMDKDAVTGGFFRGAVDDTGGIFSFNYWFEYGLTMAYGTPTANVSDNTTGVKTASMPANFAPGNTYHYRFVAENAGGTTFGSDESFTFTMPSIATLSASGITMNEGGITGGILSGNITSMGVASNTSAYAEYGLSMAYGNITANTTRSFTGSFNISMPTNLTPGATYHYRMDVQNGSVVANGNDQAFTFTMPTVATNSATNVGMDSNGTYATLNGNISSMGVASGAYVRFQYGLTNSYDSATGWQTASGGAFSAAVTHLQPDIAYHYRAVVKVGSVESNGGDRALSITPSATYSVSNGLLPVILVLVAIVGILRLASGKGISGIIVAVVIIFMVMALLVAMNGSLQSLW